MKANIRTDELLESILANLSLSSTPEEKRGDSLLSTMMKVVSSPVNCFTIVVVKQGKKNYGILIAINNNKNFYTYYNPVSFCGNSTRKKAYAVLKYGKRNILIGAEETRKIELNEIKRLKFDGYLSPEDKRLYVKTINKSKLVNSDFGKINYGDTQIIAVKDEDVEDVVESVEPETVVEEESVEPVTTEETLDVPGVPEDILKAIESDEHEGKLIIRKKPSKKKPAPVVITEEPEVEETILDKIIASQDRMSTPEAKRLSEKLIDLDIDIEILKRIEELDAKLVEKDKLKISSDKIYESYIESEIKIEDIEYLINGLYITRKKYLEAYSDFYNMYNDMLPKIEQINTEINTIKSEVESVIDYAEKEAEAKQAAIDAEKKAAEIANGLSDLERQALMKALGVVITAEVNEEGTASVDKAINMIDGSTLYSEDGTWSWPQIKSHVVDVAQSRCDKMSEKMVIYIASLNLTRKEIAEKLNSKHYADLVINALADLGLYEKKRAPSDTMTPEQLKMRALKAGESRRRNNVAKNAIKKSS